MDVGQDLIILIMTELDCLGRAFRNADTASLAEGFIDLGNVFLVDLGDPVRAAHDAHQAGRTKRLVDVGNGSANAQKFAGEKSAGP